MPKAKRRPASVRRRKSVRVVSDASTSHSDFVIVSAGEVELPLSLDTQRRLKALDDSVRMAPRVLARIVLR